MNKSLLDTDILSEVGKAIDPVVARNATTYRNIFGRYTLSAVTVTEVIRGFQKKLSLRRMQGFIASLPYFLARSAAPSPGNRPRSDGATLRQGIKPGQLSQENMQVSAAWLAT